jgi:hypothetical protein
MALGGWGVGAPGETARKGVWRPQVRRPWCCRRLQVARRPSLPPVARGAVVLAPGQARVRA